MVRNVCRWVGSSLCPTLFTPFPTPSPLCPAVQVTLSVSFIVFFLGLLPLWLCVAYRNSTTREVLFTGLQPVFTAMAISRCAGAHGVRGRGCDMS